MDPLMLSRWQFGITTVYHFLFVPLTIGLAFSVAGFQTAWYRTRKESYLRLTRFFGELFLINFALGLVTGIVQEFQFGMNWSSYSRFVGDIFGAPLAIEGLLAFFLESTFLGLWIFGWGRLSPRVHLATIWVAAIGTVLSAYFILAANSWMQHPVGYTVNPVSGRAELTDFMALLTNSTNLITFPHTIAAAFMTTGAFLAGIAMYRMLKDRADPEAAGPFRSAAKAGAIMLLVSGLLVAVTGDIQGKIMTEQQPMKMAAAEALWETEQPASFSIFTIGTPDGSAEVFSIRIPYLLSFLATGTFDGKVEGINDLQAQEEARYGPGDYTPNTPGHLLDLPLDDRDGRAGGHRGGVVPVPDAEGPHAGRPDGADRRDPAVPAAGGQLLRLDVHRDRPAALDRVRPDVHRDRRLADRHDGRGADHDDRLHAAVRGARGGDGRARGPAGQGGPATAPPPTRGSSTRPSRRSGSGTRGTSWNSRRSGSR